VSSISYSTQDRQDNWLKYLAVVDINNHVTLKGKKTRKSMLTDKLKKEK